MKIILYNNYDENSNLKYLKINLCFDVCGVDTYKNKKIKLIN